MIEIQRSALVNYDVLQMFNLVNDVESYPQFLPWCKTASIMSQSPQNMSAQLEISHGPFKKTFSTQNRLIPGEKIEMLLLNGPFKQLEGLWTFIPLDNASCKVMFQLKFEFSSKLTGMVANPIFSQIATGLVSAFCNRAQSVYGKK